MVEKSNEKITIFFNDINKEITTFVGAVNGWEVRLKLN
jgi:hypothetical protein